ncbi:MAG: hypothetical protein KGH63_03570 [Candidatus Micrarchaeota archaeon]|nr:hypothetical protein [Candidatus Micrarchaeota archaeon]
MAPVSTIIPDKVASVCARLPLPKTVSISHAVVCKEGSVMAVQALEEKTTYDMVELPDGRMAKIIKGDIIIGALGSRMALKGFVGRVPDKLAVGDTLHVLNLGGVLGHCVSENTDVGHPLKVKLLGQVMLEGQPASIRSHALPVSHALPSSAPIIMVSGTCMSAGKTLAACHIIRGLKLAGLKVSAGKVTGVSLKRDVLNMEDYGAEKGLYFTDFGLPSTVDLADVAPVAKGMVHELDSIKPDVIVLELGDGLMGGYGVRSILEDRDLRARTAVHVLCANDPVAAYGGKLFFDRLGLSIDVVAGPVTDNLVGVKFVQDELNLPGINARTDGEKLAAHSLAKIRSLQSKK